MDLGGGFAGRWRGVSISISGVAALCRRRPGGSPPMAWVSLLQIGICPHEVLGGDRNRRLEDLSRSRSRIRIRMRILKDAFGERILAGVRVARGLICNTDLGDGSWEEEWRRRKRVGSNVFGVAGGGGDGEKN
ncbi:hypothetical protein Q3G72_014546 [Acer saccharum]|nr:hypothetical protein Q3G72_014546 [Acer saccharum]